MLELKLAHVDAALANAVEMHFSDTGNPSLAAEIVRAVIPAQGIGGNPDNFSFMALSLPLVTAEQRARAQVMEEREFLIEFQGGIVRVDTDAFGRLGWFYLSNLSSLYHRPQEALIQARSRGAKSALDYSRAKSWHLAEKCKEGDTWAAFGFRKAAKNQFPR